MASSDERATTNTRRVLVIGAGPAGMMAAGQAARAGARVTLLEKMRQPGRKLSITGKGRCNVTNNANLQEFIEALEPNGKFLRQILTTFSNSDLVAFLRERGVQLELERGGRYFPVDNRAPDITRALHQWIIDQDVEIHLNTAVSELTREGGVITGARAGKLGRHYEAEAVILATGGRSYPDTGSTGDGYGVAAEVGHTVVSPSPALVPVETADNVASRLQGLSLRNVTVRLLVDGKRQAEMLGEMLFTHFGLSGPVILHLSREIVRAVDGGHEVEISIDLKPALDEKQIEGRLLREFKEHGNKQLQTILKELLPLSLIPVGLDLLGLPEQVTGNQVTTAERRTLRQWLKDFRLRVKGYRSWDEAIVTAGGIALGEINPRTLESLLVPGLYFAGELLDIDGPTGGYNLQVAFSTGWVAGRAAAGVDPSADES